MQLISLQKHCAELENNLTNMYSMDISIGPYKFRLEILVLIVIIAWIMCGHVLFSCFQMGLKEGLETMVNGVETVVGKDVVEKGRKVATEVKDAIVDDKKGKKEGFTGANDVAYGPQFAPSDNAGYIMPPAKWSMPTLEYTPGTQPDAGVQSIWDRKPQPIPVPEGQLDMLATTPFKPECCPNAYSGSTGCACMTVDQYYYLRQRGGNNIPYSEY